MTAFLETGVFSAIPSGNGFSFIREHSARLTSLKQLSQKWNDSELMLFMSRDIAGTANMCWPNLHKNIYNF